ncbi:cytochrome c oxidase subunit 2 [Lathyrus oleraceus]|uniref:Cytochrome c oxidase subunit 2 n=1 Tax=Pisum sativum TaxID=3888 RepID=A0A9D5BLS6_PEA|nr:cytochrome c oxidase subunit 2 [Pisum sativum]
MKLEWLFLTIAPCDATEPWQLGFQDAATPMMQGIIDLHHDIFFFLILILVFVSWILVRALWHFHNQKYPIPQRVVHGTTIEILRTIFSSIIPMFITIPSFALLYSMVEVVVDPSMTIKAIGHQWYQTYEYLNYNSSDEQSLAFDSYTIPEDDLELGVYYGQCSEICGTNHAFTPIVIEAVPSKDYGSRRAGALTIPAPASTLALFGLEDHQLKRKDFFYYLSQWFSWGASLLTYLIPPVRRLTLPGLTCLVREKRESANVLTPVIGVAASETGKAVICPILPSLFPVYLLYY